MKAKLPLIFIAVFTLSLCLIVLFINSTTVSSIDTWVYKEIASPMNPSLTLAMRFITESGSTMAVIILCLSLFLFTITRKEWAIPVASTVIVTSLSNVLLKSLFSRERPNILQLIYEPDYSFPSGHAMINMAFYTMIFLIANKAVKNKKLRIGISVLCVILPIIIGISRIYLGVHYASDVMAGWLLGFVISMVIFKVFERYGKQMKDK
jgi:undecaprenyl-diphosphatase